MYFSLKKFVKVIAPLGIRTFTGFSSRTAILFSRLTSSGKTIARHMRRSDPFVLEFSSVVHSFIPILLVYSTVCRVFAVEHRAQAVRRMG